MTVKLAAGLVVYRRVKGTIEYLLLQTSYGENHWSPPKGICSKITLFENTIKKHL